MRTEMSVEAKAAALRQAERVAGYMPEDLESLAATAEDLIVAPGSVFVQESRREDRCYVVVAGEASLSVQGTLVGTAGPGSIVGDPHDDPRTATAVTLMHLLVIDLDALLRTTEE